ncbi:MAG: hypothetical protein OXF25_10635 [Cyanobacteria bacterium MAG CAR3_bin_5]|nr:hypothetical protein [Cyanobacteria bacterium MAG CAR3_bin_5]
MTTLRSKLCVEGPDDVHVVGHLLLRHGIQCFIRGSQNDDMAPNAPEIKEMGGKKELLEAIRTAVEEREGREKNARSVGFVLDADDDPHSRWSAVRSHLQEIRLSPLQEVNLDPTQEIELDMPRIMPPGGYVTHVTECDMRIGVWLMPGHQREGALEQFLEDLVAEDDLLLKLAKSSTREARAKGAMFPDANSAKAVLHTWLAWQKDPGLPYGAAIKAQFFRHDSATAQAFVDWYKSLFPIRITDHRP